MNLQALQAEFQRQAIFELAIFLILTMVGFWITYIVIKTAIRDGINESNLVNSWSKTAEAAKEREAISRALPDMKADR